MTEIERDELTPGAQVEVIKLHPVGHESWRYEAVIIGERCPGNWFAVEAPWLLPPLMVHGLSFEPGDTLVEYYAPGEGFNAFRVETPQGQTRGWYGNVTYPTRLERLGDRITLTWRDLYLDVIRLPSGKVILCDEDELAASGLAMSDPELHARIEQMAQTMLALAEACEFPFHRRH